MNLSGFVSRINHHRIESKHLWVQVHRRTFLFRWDFLFLPSIVVLEPFADRPLPNWTKPLIRRSFREQWVQQMMKKQRKERKRERRKDSKSIKTREKTNQFFFCLSSDVGVVTVNNDAGRKSHWRIGSTERVVGGHRRGQNTWRVSPILRPVIERVDFHSWRTSID